MADRFFNVAVVFKHPQDRARGVGTQTLIGCTADPQRDPTNTVPDTGDDVVDRAAAEALAQILIPTLLGLKGNVDIDTDPTKKKVAPGQVKKQKQAQVASAKTG